MGQRLFPKDKYEFQSTEGRRTFAGKKSFDTFPLPPSINLIGQVSGSKIGPDFGKRILKIPFSRTNTNESCVVKG